jgi:arylsulfatase A-like enzyme
VVSEAAALSGYGTQVHDRFGVVNVEEHLMTRLTATWRAWIVSMVAVLGLASGITAKESLAAAATPPDGYTNVIVVLVDDMGWRDLSCQGSPLYETPHIDRLAASGMRFTEGYAACTVCSPTRAAMLTGQYPARLHITDWIAGHERPFAKLKIPEWRKFLPHEVVTVAERLEGAGYATASIGKWHLGDEAYAPGHHGFDINVGGYHRGQPPSYFAPYKIPTLPEGPDGEYLTDREAAESVKFIEANRGRPFFLYLPHYCVHTPIEAKADVKAKYEAKAQELAKDAGGLAVKNAGYAAMVESVDDCMGRILDTLDRLGIRDRTAIVFTSDNGGLANVTDNRPARAGKGSVYEGGVRVPLIVSWPGVTTPGTTTATPAITPDIPATILDLTGVGAEPKQPLDGVSLAPVLRGESLAREALYWHYPHYHPGGATPYSAIRAGSWRLVHFYEDGRDELYDLARDPGEITDLAAKDPTRAAELKATLDAWLAADASYKPRTFVRGLYRSQASPRSTRPLPSRSYPADATYVSARQATRHLRQTLQQRLVHEAVGRHAVS